MPSPSGYSGKKGIIWPNFLPLRGNSVLPKSKPNESMCPSTHCHRHIFSYRLSSLNSWNTILVLKMIWPNASSYDTICVCPVRRLVKEHTYTASRKKKWILNIKSRSGATSTKPKMLVNRTWKVIAVPSTKRAGHSQLFEPEETTTQMLVHPLVTVGTAGRSAQVFTAICILFSIMLFNFTFSIITLRQLL